MKIIAWFVLVISSLMLVTGVTELSAAVRYGSWAGAGVELLVAAAGVIGSVGLLRGGPWSRALVSAFLSGTIVIAFASGWTVEKLGLVAACTAGIIFLFRKELMTSTNK